MSGPASLIPYVPPPSITYFNFDLRAYELQGGDQESDVYLTLTNLDAVEDASSGIGEVDPERYVQLFAEGFLGEFFLQVADRATGAIAYEIPQDVQNFSASVCLNGDLFGDVCFKVEDVKNRVITYTGDGYRETAALNSSILVNALDAEAIR